MSYQSFADRELAVRARADPEAFGELYRRCIDRVVAFAARRSPGAADAADLVAATFLVGLEALDTYDPQKGDPLPWLLGIAARLAANRGRRGNREWAAANRLNGRRLLHDDDFARLDAQIDASRQSARLEAALSQLRARDREVLMLIGHDGLSPEEAAAVLGMRPATFRMRLTRARRALRSILDAPGQNSQVMSMPRLQGDVP
jgi:RNA polymerase sigma-70 factor, ECF subfamily